MDKRGKLVGKKIKLFPHDTYKKEAIIKDVDHLGYYLEITYTSNTHDYSVGDIVYFNHARPIHFIILD